MGSVKVDIDKAGRTFTVKYALNTAALLLPDEWPMAMCAEDGEVANIEYIKPSDNQGIIEKNIITTVELKIRKMEPPIL